MLGRVDGDMWMSASQTRGRKRGNGRTGRSCRVERYDKGREDGERA
jgi:hypothetical protein